jgi:hypothetical protein
LCSFEIISIAAPFYIQEVSPASFASGGFANLNINFEKLVFKKLGEKAVTILSPRSLAEVKREFIRIEDSFDLYDSEQDIYVPIPGTPDYPEVGSEEGFLSVSR